MSRTLTLLSLLLICPPLLWAQSSTPHAEPVTGGFEKGTRFSETPIWAQAGSSDAEKFWVSSEFLTWWTKNGKIPVLATAGGNGRLGSAGTRVILDSLSFADRARQGARLTFGHRLSSRFALEIRSLGIFNRRGDFSISSEGDPLLAQPFQNVVAGTSDALLVAAPGQARGNITIGAQVGLWGVESNIKKELVKSARMRLTILGGFRFLRLEDEVRSDQRFDVSPTVPGFGGSRVTVHDEFQTINKFYGGQLGAEAGFHLSRLSMEMHGKIAVGQAQTAAQIAGTTNSISATGSAVSFSGGLYALRSNIGRHRRSDLSYVSETEFRVGLDLTQRVTVFASHSFLWMGKVARAGEQIDTAINVSQLPIRSGDGPLIGPAAPSVKLAQSSFWAQGLNLGVQFRF